MNSKKLAIQATVHCLIGCGIGEVLGMAIATELGWGVVESIALAVTLAFIFGYSLTLIPLLRNGLTVKTAFRTAFVADTVSITSMEIVDNAVLLMLPGAIHAGVFDAWFWVSMTIALTVAFVVTVPVNYWLISRGKGHAAAHEHMHHHSH